MRRLLLACVVAAMALGIVPTAARADAPRDKGWWTATNPGGLPTAPPAPPDVPAGDLLIQGGGNAPTAYAAVLYELAPGTTVGKLTLTIAPSSATTSPTLQVCPLLQPINHPEEGGPMSDAPPYNCAHNVTAAPAADGKGYQFDAAGLVSDSLVAVAILPTGPVDRVVLDAPDANSLAAQAGATDTGPSVPDNSAVTTPSEAPSAPLPDTTGGFQSTGVSPSLADVPGASAAGPTSVSPAPAATPGSSSTGGVFVPAVSSGPEKATPLLVVLFIIAGLGGAALWLYSGRPRQGAVVNP